MKRLFLFATLSVLALAVAACAPSGARPDESGELLILQEGLDGSLRFNPDNIVLTAGQRVRLIISNTDDDLHEFMIGRNVVFAEDGAPNGFEVDFFAGIADQVTVHPGAGAMLMIDGETIMMGGEMAMGEGEEMGEMGEGEEMGEMGEGEHEHAMEGHMGWMVMSDVGSEQSVIEFTVPEDRVGEWEIGCFEDDGSHYEDGMRGKLTVVSG